MCAGAAVHARLRRLVYGADDPKAGAVHSILQVVNHPHLNHEMEIRRRSAGRTKRQNWCRNSFRSALVVSDSCCEEPFY